MQKPSQILAFCRKCWLLLKKKKKTCNRKVWVLRWICPVSEGDLFLQGKVNMLYTTRRKYFPSSSCMFSLHTCVNTQKKRLTVQIMSRIKKKNLFQSYVSMCTLLKEGKKIKQLLALANCLHSHVTFPIGIMSQWWTTGITFRWQVTILHPRLFLQSDKPHDSASVLFSFLPTVLKHAFTCRHITELIKLKRMLMYLNLDQNQFYK